MVGSFLCTYSQLHTLLGAGCLKCSGNLLLPAKSCGWRSSSSWGPLHPCLLLYWRYIGRCQYHDVVQVLMCNCDATAASTVGSAAIDVTHAEPFLRVKQSQSFTAMDHLAQTMCAMNAGWLNVAVSAATLITCVAYGARPQATQWGGALLAACCTLVACALVVLKVCTHVLDFFFTLNVDYIYLHM